MRWKRSRKEPSLEKTLAALGLDEGAFVRDDVELFVLGDATRAGVELRDEG